MEVQVNLGIKQELISKITNRKKKGLEAWGGPEFNPQYCRKNVIMFIYKYIYITYVYINIHVHIYIIYM
jgi:hypothetical protein